MSEKKKDSKINVPNFGTKDSENKYTFELKPGQDREFKVTNEAPTLNTSNLTPLEIKLDNNLLDIIREDETKPKSEAQANESLKKAGLDCKIKDVYEFTVDNKMTQFTVLFFDEEKNKVVTVRHDKTTSNGLRISNFDPDLFKQAGIKVPADQVTKPIKIEFSDVKKQEVKKEPKQEINQKR